MKNRFNLKRKLLLSGLMVFITIGCATFDGAMELEGTPPAVTWISPINQDGVKDNLNIQMSFPAYENLKIKEYQILITDQMENTVFTSGETAKKRSKKSLVLPTEFIWEGVDGSGEFVADGEYKYHIEILYGKDHIYISPEFSVIVDNTAPAVDVSAAFPLFSPDGDGRLDTVRIFQRFSSVEKEWIGTIENNSAKVTKSFIWNGLAGDFSWNGKDENDTVAPDGEYSYRISSTDEAGNKAAFNLKGIIIDTLKAPVSISRDLGSFSPNYDGKKDTLVLTPEAANITDITSWIITIHNRTGAAVKTYSGGKSLPETLIFDGKNDAGELLPDGSYKAHINISYINGSNPENTSQFFVIDTTEPLVNLSADYLLFSPENDGLRDTVTINQSTSLEQLWSASILDSKGSKVKSFSWEDRAVQFSWDALDDSGAKVPDGTYSYRIESMDNAENATVKELKGIIVDTRIPVVSISTVQKGASPNNDGISDIISLDIKTDIPEEISKWSVELLDKKGTVIKNFSSTALDSTLPSRIDWNGLDDRGLVMENEYTARLNVDYIKGNSVTSKTKTSFLIDITGPQTTLSVTPALFSPDQDGVDDILNVQTSVKDLSGVDSWKIKITDPAGNPFRTFFGIGELKTVIKWNGLSEKNELVQSASDYTVQYIVKDNLGNSSTKAAVASVDILVIKDGNNLKIIISSIYFVPNKADYLNLDDEKIAKNLATLDRLSEILKKYDQYRIRLEGHAARVYWDNPVKLQTEQNDVLMPLSTERAEVIKQALIIRGIDADRLSTIGYGGNLPVVPHSDLTNRWKNRRVEFILIKK